jgi:hypothetical protein
MKHQLELNDNDKMLFKGVFKRRPRKNYPGENGDLQNSL